MNGEHSTSDMVGGVDMGFEIKLLLGPLSGINEITLLVVKPRTV